MAQRLQLKVEPRTVLGKKVARLRDQGILPANVYGHGQSHAIQAPTRTMEHLLSHGGRTSLVDIVIEGSDPQIALFKGLTRHPRSGKLLHVDFQAVSMREQIHTSVPVRFHGEPPAVKKYDGVLLHPVSELKIEALAANLPEGIDVDLSGLVELHDSVKVTDIKAPGGVVLLDPPETVVAIVTPPKVEVEEVPEEEAEEAAAEAGEEAVAEGETEESAAEEESEPEEKSEG